MGPVWWGHWITNRYCRRAVDEQPSCDTTDNRLERRSSTHCTRKSFPKPDSSPVAPMCGICGKVDFTGAIVPQSLVGQMCETLIHRGPDAQGIHTASGIGLGQRRLSIIDLNSRGVAP